MIKNTRYTLTGARLAKICGVSQGTVDRALHGRGEINEETRNKILTIAKQYGFLSENKNETHKNQGIIGVIVLDVANEYFSNLIMSIENYCNSLGYAISVMFSLNDPKREIENIDALYRMGVDGIILCPVGGGKDEADMEIYKKYLLSLKIPVVTVGNMIEGLNYVGIDDFAAMRAVTERAISLGYKRFVYPNGIESIKQKKIYAGAQFLRYEAFIKTAKENGFSENNIILCSLNEAIDQIEDCKSTDAYICPSDIYALRLLNNATKFKAGIIGFDNISVIDTIGLKLDSVSYDTDLTAKNAVQIIIEPSKKNSLQKIIIDHKIVIRGSLG